MWQEERRVICEIRSSRIVHDPLAGRRPPSSPNDSRGLWLANQICDLVELRASAAGTVARLHVQPAAPEELPLTILSQAAFQ
jgi:hypothetical protein